MRWVRTAEQAAEAATFFALRCDQVRVMPFLEGIPCSIHGIVLPDGVLAVRPCEMVVLRRPGEATFHYAQAATFWGLVHGPQGWRFAVDDEPTDAKFTLGPGPVGGYAKVVMDPDRTPRGPSVAPRVGSALAFVDDALDLGIGPLEPARDVRI